MSRQIFAKKQICYILAVLCVSSIGLSTWASDLGNFLYGGHGSQTTVSQLYVPPPYVTETAAAPVSDSGAILTAQSQLMLGTPGAMTLPPGGVVAANGVAASTYVSPSQTPTISGVLPTGNVTLVQTPLVAQTNTQPAVESKWSFSTIKDVTYEPVTVYDPRLGGYVTTYQERQTESVLPWLHRKQVVRYKPPTESNPVGSRLNNLADRVFPVSAAPLSPAQADVAPALPLQTIPQVVTSVPVTTYASEASHYTTPSQSIVPASSTTVMRSSDLPVVPAITVPSNAEVISQPTDTTIIRSTGSTVISPTTTPVSTSPPSSTPSNVITSSVVSPSDPANAKPSLPTGTQVLYPNMQQGVTSQSPARRANEPTLAPPQSEQTDQFELTPQSGQSDTNRSTALRLNADPLAGDAGQSTAGSVQQNNIAAPPSLAQPEPIKDSLGGTEKPHFAERPEGSPLPLPNQPSGNPQQSETQPSTTTDNTTSSTETEPEVTPATPPTATPGGVPLLKSGNSSADSTSDNTPSNTASNQPNRTTIDAMPGSRSRLNISPTRVGELFR